MVKKVSIWLTLEPLLSGAPKHLAEISRELRKPHTTIRKHLAIFEKLGILSKEKKGRQTFFKLKRIPLLIDYLSIIEKEKLIEKCKKDLVMKEIVEHVHQNIDNDVLIFGSAVDSTRKANDIDMLVIGKFKEEKLNIIETKLNVKLHIISVSKLSEINESLKEEIREKHLIVQGSERLMKWLIS